MKNLKSKKIGAASFYIVAFSTLILVIIATSFATVILSEVTRTVNDDLSQSAYDSALAGVEDAKIAYSNYRRCVAAGWTAEAPHNDTSTITCGNIIYWMEQDNDSCDMVGHILGRIDKNASGEVMVKETTTSGDKDMNQAYTCVKIKTTLADYRANLSASNNVKVVGALFKENDMAAKITAIRLRWYTYRDNETLNFNNVSGSRVAFMPINSLQSVTPPTIAVSMIQTASSFTMEDLSKTVGTQTDRATLYLVPMDNYTLAHTNYGADAHTVSATFIGAYSGVSRFSGENIITAAQVAKTNDQTIKNLPYGVYCDPEGTDDFVCSTTIYLPEPVNGGRIDDTFTFIVSLPYEQPDTDFSITFLCGSTACSSSYDTVSGTSVSIAQISGVQVLIDSTGRANDLYRRVETRLEATDTSFPYPYYALELLSTDKDSTVLEKAMTITRP